MKLSIFLLFAALLGVAFATDFTVCTSTDHLGVSSVDLSEDPVVPDSDLTVTMTGTPDQEVDSGSLKLVVSVWGINILTETYNLCDVAACPLESGVEFSAAVTEHVPASTPAVSGTATVTAYDADGNDLSCISVDVTVSSLEDSKSTLSDDAAEFLLKEQFQRYKEQFNKQYEEDEEEMRFFHFKNAVERIAFKNKYGDNVFGLTKFSDMCPKEFEARYLNYSPRGPVERPVLKPTLESTPASFDWRDSSAVTAVKNQGYCGSCWAFSIVETIESAWYLAGNTMTVFSEQQVVSCDTNDYGCDGGNTPTAYEYVESAGGLATEADYPYASSSGTAPACETNFTVSGGSISGYSYATDPCHFLCSRQDEDTLASNLASVAPTSICVDASSWNDYTGGVMTSSSCSSSFFKQDHCVQLVGYSGYTGDASTSTDGYWLVRNSWDTDWGEEGYIYLQIGSNTCGVADVATTVTIA